MWVRAKGQIRIPEKGRWAHNKVMLLHSCRAYLITIELVVSPLVRILQVVVEAKVMNETNGTELFATCNTKNHFDRDSDIESAADGNTLYDEEIEVDILDISDHSGLDKSLENSHSMEPGQEETSSEQALQSLAKSGREGEVKSLLNFVNSATSDIRATLDRTASCKRTVDHRKYLQKQLQRFTSAPSTLNSCVRTASAPLSTRTASVSPPGVTNNPQLQHMTTSSTPCTSQLQQLFPSSCTSSELSLEIERCQMDINKPQSKGISSTACTGTGESVKKCYDHQYPYNLSGVVVNRQTPETSGHCLGTDMTSPTDSSLKQRDNSLDYKLSEISSEEEDEEGVGTETTCDSVDILFEKTAQAPVDDRGKSLQEELNKCQQPKTIPLRDRSLPASFWQEPNNPKEEKLPVYLSLPNQSAGIFKPMLGYGKHISDAAYGLPYPGRYLLYPPMTPVDSIVRTPVPDLTTSGLPLPNFNTKIGTQILPLSPGLGNPLALANPYVLPASTILPQKTHQSNQLDLQFQRNNTFPGLRGIQVAGHPYQTCSHLPAGTGYVNAVPCTSCDPLFAAMSSASRPSLWRPIPTKTFSSLPSRYHPFAGVH